MHTRRMTRLLAAGRIAALAVLAAAAFGMAPARAQVRDAIEVANFLIPGGYFFTSDATRDALDSALYYHEADLFRRSFGVGVAGVSGSLKVINASSQVLPFTGDNQFSLIGPSIEVATARVAGWRPHASIGFFAGQVKSNRRGIDKWDFTPSLAVGVSYSFVRLIRLTAEYRLAEDIAGIDGSGVALRLSLF